MPKALRTRSKIFIGQQDHNTAREYLKKSLDLLSLEKNHESLVDTYFSYGRTFYGRNKDSAIHYYDKSLKLAIESENLYYQGHIYIDLAYINIYNSKIENINELLDQSKSISEKIGNNVLLHHIYYLRGFYYDLLEDYDTAIVNYKVAINDYGKVC